MAVNVQAQGGAKFGFGAGLGDGQGSLAGQFDPSQPAFWSVALGVFLLVIVVLIALSAWEKI